MYYTGIGSRSTPKEVLAVFEYLGSELAKRGYILRSGGADGADTAFERGCDKAGGQKEIYLPWKGFGGSSSSLYQYDQCGLAFQIAKHYHPYYGSLSNGGKVLIARDGYQVFGRDLHTPCDFIICYTKDGKGEGGTGQAIRIARDWGIKVCDFGRFPKEQAMDAAKKVLSAVDKELFKTGLLREMDWSWLEQQKSIPKPAKPKRNRKKVTQQDTLEEVPERDLE